MLVKIGKEMIKAVFEKLLDHFLPLIGMATSADITLVVFDMANSKLVNHTHINRFCQ